MTTSIMIHEIEIVKFGNLHMLESGTWCIDLSITTKQERFTISLFSENPSIIESLESII